MKKKAAFLVLVLTSLFVLLGQSVYAFSDTNNDPNASQIDSLQKQGILSGSGDKFMPNGKLTNAEGISLLVKAFELKDTNVYIKEPKASDYFTKVKDQAWYSSAFVTAFAVGLDLPKDIDPAAAMTREQFAHYLFQAMTVDHDLAIIMLAIIYDDEEQVNPDYRGSVQNLLVTKIAKLDNNKFKPKQSITRSTAAGWLYNALELVKQQTEQIDDSAGGLAYDMKLSVNAINELVNEVTVTATLPHPGYGLRISSIAFNDNTAFIKVEVTQPDPNRMYPQVLTEAKTVTYVSAEYKPIIIDTNSGIYTTTDGADESSSSAA
ncbi:S-layer homology domain-containing protein [Paenibacillus xylaniclasticus]|uniref:S-layer homology domain-containing protein n=1 Tax=Paenibacillus xylaniclasticus TaxID=588083 RepID=UPI000FDB50C0|nr:MULTISPECIES: S-layer homology domain-containing protein [Paenibacillus]GFN34129.1 hypothetical protein PCURB6_43890 [Paenibacillus curdlanolyticus]